MGATHRPTLRIVVVAAAVATVAGSGVAIGRTTASCTVTVARQAVARSVAPASPPANTTDTAHTLSGARSAVERFASLLAGNLITQPDAYRAAVIAIAAPASRAELLDRVDASLAALNSRLGLADAVARGVQVVMHTVPVTAHVDAYDGTVARVRVWAVGVFAVDGTTAPTAVWAAATYVVEWTDDGWRLDAVDDEAALVPRTPQQATTDTAMPPELRDLEDGDASTP